MKCAVLYFAEGPKYHSSRTPVFAIGMTWVNSKPWLSKYVRRIHSIGETIKESIADVMHIRRRIWFHRSFYTIQARCEKEMTSTSYRPCHLTYKWTLFAVFVSSFQMTERADSSSFPPATIMSAVTRCRAFFYMDLRVLELRLLLRPLFYAQHEKIPPLVRSLTCLFTCL